MNHLAVSLTEPGERKEVVNALVDFSVRANTPILTLYVLKLDSLTPLITTELSALFTSLDTAFLHKHQVKVSFIGQWYDLPEQLVTPMKSLMEATKDYDAFFLNFCVNYDGQEEIVAACKVLNIQIMNQKLTIDGIDTAAIKQNIYNSYFLPPDVIIYAEGKRNSFLLWDSFRAKTLCYEGALSGFMGWVKGKLH